MAHFVHIVEKTIIDRGIICKISNDQSKIVFPGTLKKNGQNNDGALYMHHFFLSFLLSLLFAGENLAKDMGCTFVEISASENYENVLEVFLELYREIRMYKFGSRSSIFGRMFGHSREKKMLTL